MGGRGWERSGEGKGLEAPTHRHRAELQPGALSLSLYLILTTAEGGRYYSPHFTDENLRL